MCGLASEVVLNQNLYYLKVGRSKTIQSVDVEVVASEMVLLPFPGEVVVVAEVLFRNLRGSVMRLLWAASMCGSLGK